MKTGFDRDIFWNIIEMQIKTEYMKVFITSK